MLTWGHDMRGDYVLHDLRQAEKHNRRVVVTKHWRGDFTGVPVEVNNTYAIFKNCGTGEAVEIVYTSAEIKVLKPIRSQGLL